MTGRSTTRRMAPPGGESSFSIGGWGSGASSSSSAPQSGKGKRINQGLEQASLLLVADRVVGALDGTAHLFPTLQLQSASTK